MTIHRWMAAQRPMAWLRTILFPYINGRFCHCVCVWNDMQFTTQIYASMYVICMRFPVYLYDDYGYFLLVHCGHRSQRRYCVFVIVPNQCTESQTPPACGKCIWKSASGIPITITWLYDSVLSFANTPCQSQSSMGLYCILSFPFAYMQPNERSSLFSIRCNI